MTRNASTATATNSTNQRVSHPRLRPPCPCLLALCLLLRCPLYLSSSLPSSPRSPRLKPVADVTRFAHPRWPTPQKRTPQYLSPRDVYRARHLATRSSLETTHFVGHAYRIWLYFPLLNSYVSFICLSVFDPSPTLSVASSLYVVLAPDIERYRPFRLCPAVAHQHLIRFLHLFFIPHHAICRRRDPLTRFSFDYFATTHSLCVAYIVSIDSDTMYQYPKPSLSERQTSVALSLSIFVCVRFEAIVVHSFPVSLSMTHCVCVFFRPLHARAQPIYTRQIVANPCVPIPFIVC